MEKSPIFTKTRIIPFLIMITLTLLLLSAFPLKVVAENAYQAPTSISNLDKDKPFTDVAGSGQSIQATRTKNDYSLILAGFIGIVALILLGALSHRRTKRGSSSG